MKNETARREIESLDYYLQNHTDDYSEESHTAMMMATKALDQEPCNTDTCKVVKAYMNEWDKPNNSYATKIEELEAENDDLRDQLAMRDRFKQEPCDDATLKDIFCMGCEYKEQEPKAEQFAKWVAEEIFDEENWEYNKDAFAEIACRKLAKLGIVRKNGNVWELVESQESENRE